MDGRRGAVPRAKTRPVVRRAQAVRTSRELQRLRVVMVAKVAVSAAARPVLPTLWRPGPGLAARTAALLARLAPLRCCPGRPGTAATPSDHFATYRCRHEQPNNDRSAPISASLMWTQGFLSSRSVWSIVVGRTLTSRRIVTSLYSTATKTSHVRANNASPSDQSVFIRVNKRIASARTPFAGAGCRLLVAGARRAASFDGGTRLGKGGVMALAQPCAQNRCTV